MLKILFRVPKSLFTQWMRHFRVQSRNPKAIISFPVALLYDDVKAIQIGANSLIGAFSEIVVIAKSPYDAFPGQLVIEENVVIGSHANIRAAGGEIFIGRDSMIAQHVSLIAQDHKVIRGELYRELPWDESKRGVYIGRNVWIGAGATVLAGCTIGENSVIGAGSVVTKRVPPNEIWAGVPARKIKDVPSWRSKLPASLTH